MSTGYLDNFYARLGVPKHASAEQIRVAYLQAARHMHPDTHPEEGATELFLQVQEAYEVLSSNNKRVEYDKTLPDDIVHPPDILVNTLYSRQIIPYMNNPQLVYVLLDLLALPSTEDHENTKRPPLNISLVLDTSTSMSGVRLDMVKTTAIQLVRQLESHDTLSIIAFNDKAEVVLPATRGVMASKIESRISLLQTGGGTEIGKGIRAGIDEVKMNATPSSINHIILITDGRTYGDEDKSIQMAYDVVEKKISISGIGIGNNWNDEFIDELTKITGGSSMYARTTEDINSFLTKKFNSLSQIYADYVNLEMDTTPDVKLRYAFRIAPEPGPLSLGPRIHIGSIPRGPSLSIILEFEIKSVSARQKFMTLAEGHLNMEIPTRAVPSHSTRFSFSRPTGEQPEMDPPPQALVKAMSRLSLYRMQEQARLDLEAGDYEKATQRLQNLATQLLAAGEPGLAHTVILEIKDLEAGNTSSLESKKRIKYGTRALMRPPNIEELNS